MRTAEARTWIDAPFAVVDEVVADSSQLSSWLRLVDVDRRAGGRLVAEAEIDVTLTLRRPERARLTVVRVVRGVRHLAVEGEQGTTGTVCLGVSPWDGGTAVEVRVELSGDVVPRSSVLRRQLRHAMTGLGPVVVGRPAPTLVGGDSTPRWRDQLTLAPDARPVARQ